MGKLQTIGKITNINMNNQEITELEISEHKTLLGNGINGRMKIVMDKQAMFEFTQLAIKDFVDRKYKGGNQEFMLKKLKETLEGKTIEITIK